MPINDLISETFRRPSIVPIENVGIHGSFSYTVLDRIRNVDGKLQLQPSINFHSSVSSFGNLSVVGNVKLILDGETVSGSERSIVPDNRPYVVSSTLPITTSYIAESPIEIPLGSNPELEVFVTYIVDTDNGSFSYIGFNEPERISLDPFVKSKINPECFPAGTPILMSDGTEKPIESIEIGDEVLAFDGLGKLVPKRVLRLFQNPNKKLIKLPGNVEAGVDPLLVTPGHHFLCGDGSFDSLFAISSYSQKREMELVGVSGKLIPFTGFEPVEGLHTVYNFEVEDLHTYVSGGYRVHNLSLSVFEATTDIGRVSATLGAKLGSIYGNQSEVAELLSSAAGEVVLGTLGDVIGYYTVGDSEQLNILESLEGRAPGTLARNTVSLISSTVSNLLIEELDIDNRFAATGLNTVAGVGAQYLYYQNVYDLVQSGALSADIGARVFGLTPTTYQPGTDIVTGVAAPVDINTMLTNAGAAAIGSVAAGELYQTLIDWNVFSENVHANGSAIGATAGAAIATSITAATTAAGSAVAGFVGAFVGQVVGNFVAGLADKWFGNEQFPRSAGIVLYDAETDLFVVDHIYELDGGNPEAATRFSDIAKDLINAVRVSVGGDIVSDTPYWYGHYFESAIYQPECHAAGGSSRKGRIEFDIDNAKQAIESGVLRQVATWELENVDPYIKAVVDLLPSYGEVHDVPNPGEEGYIEAAGVIRVYGKDFPDTTNFCHLGLTEENIEERNLPYNPSLDQFIADLTIAQEYSLFKDNPEIYLALIDNIPDSQAHDVLLQDFHFRTLPRVRELGLGGSQIIIGGDGFDNLSGGSGEDELLGGYGHDTLEGRDGYDSIEGQAGNDSLYGGNGGDTIRGGDGHERIWGDDGNDSLYGDSGSDILRGGNDQDYLDAGTGDDYLNGESGDDTLEGRDGKDSLYGEGGDDELYGRDGNDSLEGGLGRDYFDGGRDQDILNGGEDDDTMHGGAGEDTLNGDAGHDFIIAGTENDSAEGGQGNDLLLGGYGADTLGGGDGNDFIDGEQGSDSLYGGDGSDTILGGDQHERIWGDNGDDFLYGESGSDILRGGNDQDYLESGTGDDYLNGEGGNDTLHGGDGNDKYAFGFGGGKDYFFDQGSSNSSNDILEFEEGITPEQINFALVGNDSGQLKITFSDNNSDEIIIDQWDQVEGKIETITFTNGAVLTFDDVQREVVKNSLREIRPYSNQFIGDENRNIIHGTAQNDWFIGNGGVGDFFYGKDGADTYIYQNNVIFIDDESTSEGDAVFLEGNITRSDLLFGRRGSDPTHQYYDDLKIIIGADLPAETNEIIIIDHLNPDLSGRVEELIFSDGSVLTHGDIQQNYL